MYPKVKVLDQDEDDQRPVYDHNRSSSMFLNDFQSLSIYDSCFSVMEHQDVSPPLVARIPKAYIPNVVRPTTYLCEEQKNEKFDEEEKPNIRAGPILRPRAVLSSPDNDAVIGSKNKIKTERPSSLKNHNQTRNRHSQCKVIMSHANIESAINTGKSEDANNKSDVTGNKGLATSVSRQRRYLRAGKPSSLRI